MIKYRNHRVKKINDGREPKPSKELKRRWNEVIETLFNILKCGFNTEYCTTEIPLPT